MTDTNQPQTWHAWGERGVMVGEGEKSRILFTVEGEHLADEQHYRDIIIADHATATRFADAAVEVVPVGSTDHLEWRVSEAEKTIKRYREALADSVEWVKRLMWLIPDEVLDDPISEPTWRAKAEASITTSRAALADAAKTGDINASQS